MIETEGCVLQSNNIRVIKRGPLYITQRLSQVGPGMTGAVRYDWITLCTESSFSGAERVFIEEKAKDTTNTTFTKTEISSSVVSSYNTISAYTLLSTLWKKVQVKQLFAQTS